MTYCPFETITGVAKEILCMSSEDGRNRLAKWIGVFFIAIADIATIVIITWLIFKR